MPQEATYGFWFEKAGELPGHSLRDAPGSPSGEEVLAEQVADELARVEQELADLRAELSRGWQFVASGVESSTGTFTVDVTAGGDYLAGTFDMFRLHLRGHLDGDGHPWLRINDNTSAIYLRGMTSWQADGTAIDWGGNAHEDGATHWRLGQWSNLTSNVSTVQLYRTGASGLIGMQADTTRNSATASFHRTSRAWGRLNSALLLSSLTVGGTFGGSSQFESCRWWLEGFRAS